MLRKEFPFKISIAGSPRNEAKRVIERFMEVPVDESVLYVTHGKRMDIDGFTVQLFIKVLPLETQYSRFRIREFQGSIGMIYIFSMSKYFHFEGVLKDFSFYEEFFGRIGVQPVLLGINPNSDGLKNDVEKELAVKNLKLVVINQPTKDNISNMVKSVISSSKTFISTTQGSCDVDLESNQ
jgi:hypothetical protein